MSLLIISSSLNPDSNSRKLAHAALEHAKAKGYEVNFIEMCKYPVDICDGGSSFSHESLEPLNKLIGDASAIVLCGPIYAYAMAAATKNLIELTGKNWTGKPVGLMAAAGGKNSYMAVLGTANSLMLDYRCPIVPKYVYGDASQFDEKTGELSAALAARVAELVETTHHWGEVL